jgi:class 3 adenylate cyclase/predicted ATPase
LLLAATEFCADEAQMIAQDIEQRGAAVGGDANGAAVHSQRDWFHSVSSTKVQPYIARTRSPGEAISIDVADWLSGLGLGQYGEVFAANDIDSEVLPELTADDLTGLGITSIGHRRKLLAAVAALRADAPGPVAETAPAAATTSREAERRQLTVMFCDLVGSTPLSTRFDPEDLREIIGAYHRCVADTVGRFGGFIAKYMGDGVLVYFGYPEAHEDDAERAVRAGLAVIDAVGRLGTLEPLNARLGVASGLVVVGDLIGAGAAQERGVVGETPNLAARLQALAPPDALIIAESTRRQIGALFELRDLGMQPLAGFPQPQHVWRAVGESGVLSRFEALRSQTAPLVGRDEELDLMLRRWHQAKTGDGRVVLISGEPGIGKSRLLTALSERIVGEPHTRLRYFCSPHHQESPLYPFITQLERTAGFTHRDTVEEKLGKLRDLLAAAGSDDEIQLVAELLSLPNTVAALGLSPQRKREMVFEALLHQFEALTQGRPVVMLFEDAHWVDPSSRELLDLMLDWVARLPVLLMVTFRTELQQSWSGQPHVTLLALDRLGEPDVTALVRELAGNAPLGSGIVAEIVERADGVPLFVEELTRAVVESGRSGEPGWAVLAASPLPNLSIPATLHASLIARLDRLGSGAKDVAQIGAVIGREFPYELIQPVAQRPQPDLEAALDRLTDAGLLFRRGPPPHYSYLFKHALVQDAAYATLLRSRRQQLHAAIAGALEREFPEIAAAQPELLAHHYTEAALRQQAIDNWLRAGERANEASANPEAIAHLTRGLKFLEDLPESSERDEKELAFQIALQTPLFAARFGSAEGERAAQRAVELSRKVAGANQRPLVRALFGLSLTYLSRGQIRSGREVAEELLGVAERLQEPETLAYAHNVMGNTLFWHAELGRARMHLEKGIALYQPEWSRSLNFRFGFNAASTCHFFLGRVLWHLGYSDQALTSAEQAVTIAEAVSHRVSRASALTWLSALRQLRGETGCAREVAEIALAITTEEIIPFFRAHAIMLRGWALVGQRQGNEGVAQLREGYAAYRADGAQIECSHWLALLAEAYRDTGRPAEGLHLIGEALDHVAQTGVVYYEAELHRLDDELRLRLDTPEQQRAEASFRHALEIARRQQAKSWELRAATSLARLWAERGRRVEARDLLVPVYSWFTEGFDTADLKQAAVLLAELA